MNVTPNFPSGTSGGFCGAPTSGGGGFDRAFLGFRQPRKWLPHLQQAGGRWWCTYGNESCAGDTMDFAFKHRAINGRWR